MVVDTLKNCAEYFALHEKFEKAFAFIKQAVADGLAVGKYEIEGADLYASVQEYNSKLPPEGKFEGHRKYIDIQYIVSGKEVMEVADVAKMTAKTEYNDVKDVEFYEDVSNASKCVVEMGDYCVFFPQDIHKPCMAIDGVSTPVKKIVVKVKI
ncbi:MAG: YhcH/YjgK/YiaL family protein [Clostridia bacterium]|nr:YhcH/YjgK/YiaL family protein [Clostridia bacterium]